jgi:alpha-D-ribose 1-methylphosphonate 5-triphosphate diphosphatase
MVDRDANGWYARGLTPHTPDHALDGVGVVDEETLVVRSDRIVTPDGIRSGHLVVRGDRILGIERQCPRPVDHTVDARGLVVVPGLVDLHGDELERYVHPRDAARESIDSALTACDRALLAAGITTKCHAIAFEDVPERNRSHDLAAELTARIASGDVGFADHRVHPRCELSDPVSVDAVTELLGRFDVDLVSMMTHAPGQGQFADEQRFEQQYPTAAANGSGLVDRRLAVDAGEIEARRRRLAEAALDTGTTLATHDDDDPDRLARTAAHGVSIAEYPVSLPVARRARSLGLTVAMGAPNLVRGGSMWGNLAVAEAVDAGVVDVLCSDYRAASMLEAAFVDTGEPLPERIARVTSAPADAIGLSDRGRLEPGARADLLLVDPTAGPTVRATVVAGMPVYRAGKPLSALD